MRGVSDRGQGVTVGVKCDRVGSVMHLVLADCADGRSLDLAQRAALVASLRDVNPDLRAVLIRWERPRHGLAPDLPDAEDHTVPTLRETCHAIETCARPVFVLIEGGLGGQAAELALAAHGRLALPMARMQFAAVRLGLISACGTTQRLPRLLGAAEALRLLCDGPAVGAAEALAMGLVDHVIDVEGDHAVQIAAVHGVIDAALQGGTFPLAGLARSAGLRDGRAYLAGIAARRADAPKGDPCQAAVINCVEAAMLLPGDQGLEFESSLSKDLSTSARAQALCHLFRAERRAEQMPEGLRDYSPAPVRHVGVVGAVPAYSGLVLTALTRGAAVTVIEPDRTRLVGMLKAVANAQEAAVAAGRLTANQRDADWARLATVEADAALEAADLLLVLGEAQVPPARMSALIAQRKGRAVLVTGRGEVPNGAFRLILTGRVAEIALPPGAGAQPCVQAITFLRQLGFTVLPVGPQSPIGLAGRLGGAGGSALRAMLAMGVSDRAIGQALSDFGLRPPILTPVEGVAPHAMPPEEIVNRWLAALANEGARLLSAGMAFSPMDIDLVAVVGMGFPRDKGGPLHQADQRGLLVVRRDLTLWADEAEIWKPLPAWDALVSLGRGFAGIASPV